MSKVRFDVAFTRGAALRMHQKTLASVERDYPWHTLDASRYPAELLLRARRGWTENALNEHCTGAVLGQMLQHVVSCGAPLDLISMASRFPLEEVIHVELCARVADRLGGLYPLEYDPDAIAVPLDPSLTPLQRASELVVRVCCVGEAFSLPMLTGAMKSAAHPVTRKVLETIVADEALHGRFGWLFLEWAAPSFSKAERARLAVAARDTMRLFEPLWQKLTSTVHEGVTSEGFLLSHVHELGWMESGAYRALAIETVQTRVREPLARFGIDWT